MAASAAVLLLLLRVAAHEYWYVSGRRRLDQRAGPRGYVRLGPDPGELMGERNG